MTEAVRTPVVGEFIAVYQGHRGHHSHVPGHYEITKVREDRAIHDIHMKRTTWFHFDDLEWDDSIKGWAYKPKPGAKRPWY